MTEENSIPVDAIFIEWVDIETHGEGNNWADKEDLEDWISEPPIRFHTVGCLVYEDEHIIVVTETMGDTQCSSMTKIPQCCIKRKEYLFPKRNEHDLPLRE
jgi:hypothetical protein